MSENQDAINKSVDESWKDTVQKEKTQEPAESQEEQLAPEVSFNNFVTSLSLQVLIFLGEIESPLTGKKEENLQQAKFIIDTLDMLKDKTTSNLSEEETNLLENLLYELKMKYVERKR